jgi:hypothetical protein
MHKARTFCFVCAGLLCLALPLPRPAAAAWPADTLINVPLCTAPGDQTSTRIVSDGAGGAIVTWQDYRSGTSYDIYAERVSAAGAPQWAASGVAVGAVAGDQQNPAWFPDGAGGRSSPGRTTASGKPISTPSGERRGVPQWTANGGPCNRGDNTPRSPRRRRSDVTW